MDDHILLITNEFIQQSSVVTNRDLLTWYWMIEQTQGVGFFNSNYAAGASQRHKHYQMIPLDVIKKKRGHISINALPIDDLINKQIKVNHWNVFDASNRQVYSRSEYVYQLDEYKFKHGIVLLRSRSQYVEANNKNSNVNEDIDIEIDGYANYLQDAYQSLLHHTDTVSEGSI